MKLSYRLILCAISLLLFFSATDTYGQSPPGVSKFQEVETDMKSFYVALSRLSFVVGAVSGLLGGLRVYNNWQMGRHQIDVQVVSWFGACLFLATMGFFLSGLYAVPLT
ncbi:MAG TPA: plasmid transfer protein [Algoriphagus sp.]|jgi:hypothetical protein|uniref:DUF4134 family protein n=1 Tax=unclassified Algoriphagus TaxID=2641541 RepID=UPI000C4FBAFE|nr:MULTISPECIES: DUF4134 family protein [unclassified Algoriphagus]MAL13715.1 plasmid transfer protein [Algoriphagus sp.]HAS58691.1 plasmid transfer protein [Algoriphagus sp.]HAZ25780.1 plasmid transfer protein [Algoriphagus sp.]HCB45540.1 plasmid transfer protein [Algoriphagus sp.]HCD87892.1 plasmid transfer protein [Algoriphagus sp.]|tara:strand:- start:345 stop:671 length:327 start_codon:yes stop_codon:yes gene_type:complete